MQRIPKKPTSNKWDPQRRIQTEANDDNDFDINQLMKKYKKNIANDQGYQAYGNTQSNNNIGSNTNYNNSSNTFKRGITGSNYGQNRKPQIQGGNSVDKLRKSTSNTGNSKNGVLQRNMNFNRSLVQNNSNNNNGVSENYSNYQPKSGSQMMKNNYSNSRSMNQQSQQQQLLQQQQQQQQQQETEYYQQQQQQQQSTTQSKIKNSNTNSRAFQINNPQPSRQTQQQRLSQQMQSSNSYKGNQGNNFKNNMSNNNFGNNNINNNNNNNNNNMQDDVSTRIQTEPAQTSSQQQQNLDPSKFTYINEKVVGSGTFGVVYKARIKETGQSVAIKKVLQDKRYKNRELQILQELNHPNVLKMIYAYYSQGDNDETYLHVVMQYIPETLYSLNRHYIKQRQYMPSILVKLYSYQIMRSLIYIHTQGICHRDIKPHNILVDPSSNRVVMCDFGSAKKLVVGEPNISYICSRCYRAPELIFGATDYTNQIDVWSNGCVIAEIINGEPLFIGESAVDQLVEIIKVLGTPSKEQVLQMNQHYDLKDYKFPQIKAKDWKKVLRSKTDPVCIDFISKILVYSPVERLNPLEAIAHPYFDELRDEKKLKTLSTKIRIPNLFDFTKSELSMSPELTHKVIPDWYFEKYGIKSHH